MKNVAELIVMLTYEDFTVKNAAEIFEACKYSKAIYWGLKEHPLSQEEMKKLFSRMKECGKTTFLEVVAYTEKEGLEGAKIAAECGGDMIKRGPGIDMQLQINKAENIRLACSRINGLVIHPGENFSFWHY